MATCKSLCFDGQHNLCCWALLSVAKQLAGDKLPAGLRPGWSWLGEIDCGEDIPF